MELKRIYDEQDLARWREQTAKARAARAAELAGAKLGAGALELELAAAANAVAAPWVDHVEVRHTGTHAEQNFSSRLVASGMLDGWIAIAKGRLVISAKPEDLVYAIERTPGYYSCFTGEALADQHVAKAHVAAQGKPSPDPANPAGYVRINHYECVLEAGLHEKYRARKEG